MLYCALEGILSRAALNSMRFCEDCLSVRSLHASPAAASSEAQLECESKPSSAQYSKASYSSSSLFATRIPSRAADMMPPA